MMTPALLEACQPVKDPPSSQPTVVALPLELILRLQLRNTSLNHRPKVRGVSVQLEGISPKVSHHLLGVMITIRRSIVSHQALGLIITLQRPTGGNVDQSSSIRRGISALTLM
jgi:hypothetical protein